MEVSTKGNFVQYHVRDNDTEVWVIDDFNTVSNYRNNSIKLKDVFKSTHCTTLLTYFDDNEF